MNIIKRSKFIRNRKYSTKDISVLNHEYKVIHHKITNEEASKIFSDNDKRIFAPNNLAKILPKKVFLPFYGLYVTVNNTKYKGEYGTQHTGVTVDTKGKLVTYTYTVWHETKGKLESHSYSDSDKGLRIYAGYTWDNKIIEQCMENYVVKDNLVPFDKMNLEDLFLMDEDIAKGICNDHIHDYEKQRACEDISKRKNIDNTRIEKLTYDIDIKISRYYLPAYVLQYPDNPPRFLSAVNQYNKEIFGDNPISPAKTMITSFIVCTFISIMVPQIAIPARIACIVGSSGMVGAWTKYRLPIANTYQLQSIADRRAKDHIGIIEAPKMNKMIEATKTIKMIEAPKIIETTEIIKMTVVNNMNQKYLKVLGIKNDEINNQIIEDAYNEINKNYKGSNKERISFMQDTVEAKRVLLNYIKNNE